MNIKLIAIAAGLAFTSGTIGGGYAVHKLWWGKTQAAKVKALKTDLSAAQADFKRSEDLRVKEAKRADSEADARGEAEQRLSQAYADNARLAASRASTTTHYIKEGEQIGQELKSDYPCVYSAWPVKLSNYAFGADGPQDLPRPASGGYPARE